MKQVLSLLLFSMLIFSTNFSATEDPTYTVTSASIHTPKGASGINLKGEPCAFLPVESIDEANVCVKFTLKANSEGVPPEVEGIVILTGSLDPFITIDPGHLPHPAVAPPSILVTAHALKHFVQGLVPELGTFSGTEPIRVCIESPCLRLLRALMVVSDEDFLLPAGLKNPYFEMVEGHVVFNATYVTTHRSFSSLCSVQQSHHCHAQLPETYTTLPPEASISPLALHILANLLSVKVLKEHAFNEIGINLKSTPELAAILPASSPEAAGK